MSKFVTPKGWEPEVLLPAVLGPIIAALIAVGAEYIPAIGQLEPSVVTAVVSGVLLMAAGLIYARVNRTEKVEVEE